MDIVDGIFGFVFIATIIYYGNTLIKKDDLEVIRRINKIDFTTLLNDFFHFSGQNDEQVYQLTSVSYIKLVTNGSPKRIAIDEQILNALKERMSNFKSAGMNTLVYDTDKYRIATPQLIHSSKQLTLTYHLELIVPTTTQNIESYTNNVYNIGIDPSIEKLKLSNISQQLCNELDQLQGIIKNQQLPTPQDSRSLIDRLKPYVDTIDAANIIINFLKKFI